MSVFIIAEAGANHNKDFSQAKRLIDVAKYAGADAVKFQTYSSSTLYSKNTPDFAVYKDINKLIDDIALPREWQAGLKEYCDKLGIEFMSTPFDESAVSELKNLGVHRLKISGFESTDPRFVRMVARTRLPLVISAGIGCDIPMINNIIMNVHLENTSPDITILHCNNAYPTPITDAGLSQIDLIKKTYPFIKVGLSDHTTSTMVPALAVAKGASCVEKHFTLSRNLPGPDHAFALEPEELKEMVDNVRLAELACGTKTASYSNSEKSFKKARRSVVTVRALKKGEVLTEENITTKRPLLDDSVPAVDYYNILGATVNRDLEEDVIVERAMLC